MRNLCFVLAFFVVSALQADLSGQIVFNTPATANTVNQNQSLFWDILSDQTSLVPFGAVGDFELTDHGDFHINTSVADIVGLPGNSTGGAFFGADTLIGIDSNFGGTSSFFIGTTDFGGEVNFGERGYFGLSVILDGQTHFGWVEISEDISTQTIHGWAYNATPNAPILTGATGVPEPNSSILALGLSLAAVLRRKRTCVA